MDFNLMKRRREEVITRENLLLIVLCAVMILPGTASFAVNRDFKKAHSIRVGILTPVEMPVGQGIIDGAKMAAENINAAGGVEGKKIKLFIKDTASSPEKEITAVKMLALQRKVDLLIGEYNSGVALAIQPFLSKYDIGFVVTGCASPELTANVRINSNRYKYFFLDMINSDRMVK